MMKFPSEWKTMFQTTNQLWILKRFSWSFNGGSWGKRGYHGIQCDLKEESLTPQYMG
jgi:hypothetical protein